MVYFLKKRKRDLPVMAEVPAAKALMALLINISITGDSSFKIISAILFASIWSFWILT